MPRYVVVIDCDHEWADLGDAAGSLETRLREPRPPDGFSWGDLDTTVYRSAEDMIADYHEAAGPFASEDE